MNKYKLTILLFIVAISGAVGQSSKPRKVTIKKSITISKDSTYYLPDTIAVVFKELIIRPDTVFEKWNRGYLVWQTWSSRGDFYGITGTTVSSGTFRYLTVEDKSPIKTDYYFPTAMAGKFLYQNYKPVTNKVINVYSN